jgi:hypothetical protein
VKQFTWIQEKVTARGGKQGETVTARLSPMMVALTAKFIRIGRMSRANTSRDRRGNEPRSSRNLEQLREG